MSTPISEHKTGKGFVVSSVGRLSDSDLKEIITNALEKYSYRFLIGQTLIQYNIIKFPEDFDCTGFAEAQAFGDIGELHWKREIWHSEKGKQHGWRIVYTGRMEKCPDLLLPGIIDLSCYNMDERTEVFLRGEKKEGQTAWFDLRIPKPLQYPVDTKKEVAIHINIFKLNGCIEFVQLAGLEPAR